MKPAVDDTRQPPEQGVYAALLEWGTRIGLALLLLSFVAYVTGWMPAQVPPQRLPELWVHPVGRFLALSGLPDGWGWLTRLDKADIAGLLGIAILAGSSVLSLLALVPLYRARRDTAFVCICLAEVAVVLLAASGLLTGAR